MSKFLRLLNLFQSSRETNFEEAKIGFQSICLKILCLTILTQASAIFFCNPLHINLFRADFLIMFLSAMVILIITYIVVSHRFRQYSGDVISLIVIGFIVGSSEAARLLFVESDWTPAIYLLMGMSFQTGCLFLIISRLNWKRNTFSLWMLQSYIWLRGLDIRENPTTQKPVLITLLIYLIILPLFCYLGEKEERRVYSKTKSLQENLKIFENLLRNVIPSSIIIFGEGEIKFFNEKTKEMFLVETKIDLMRILGALRV
jgi:hypothetical protein